MKDYAGSKILEFGLAQDLSESSMSELQIAVGFHVQHDEFGSVSTVLNGRSVDSAKGYTYTLERGIEGEGIELGADRGDLHRDGVDSGVGEQAKIGLHMALSFSVPEDFLAQLIDVDPDARSFESFDCICDPMILAWDKIGASFVDDALSNCATQDSWDQ